MTRIRPARPADLPRLRTIQQRTLVEPWPALLETATRGSPPMFVRVDGVPVGYVIYLEGPESVVYVPELAVHPDRQRQGHGSELVSFLVDHLTERGYTEVRLTVRADDRGARRFYERHSFDVLERLEAHFRTGDGLLLSRTVHP